MRVGSFYARHGLTPLAAGVALAVVSVATPAAAANKEHQQMMAEVRMLQEQNAQLQQSIGTLVDALKTVTAKLDEQAATTRKTTADARLLVEGLSGELRVVREKIDDTHVRLGSLAQEVDALRNSMPQGRRRRRGRSGRAVQARPPPRTGPTERPTAAARTPPPVAAPARPPTLPKACRPAACGTWRSRLRRRPVAAASGLRDLHPRFPRSGAGGRRAVLHRRGLSAGRQDARGAGRLRTVGRLPAQSKPRRRLVLQARRHQPR